MESPNSDDLSDVEPEEDVGIDDPSTSSPSRLFGSQDSVHPAMAGRKASDSTQWRQQHMLFGIGVAATVSWLLIERSGISFLSLSSDILLIIVVSLFLRANYAVYRKKPLPTLPGLVLSEEMINNAASVFRVKVNYFLLMAHDITLGKDFRLFFKVLIALWLLSVCGSIISFSTLAYIGIIISLTLPALNEKFGVQLDRCTGMIQRSFTKHYKIVDDRLHPKLPKPQPKDKDS